MSHTVNKVQSKYSTIASLINYVSSTSAEVAAADREMAKHSQPKNWYRQYNLPCLGVKKII